MGLKKWSRLIVILPLVLFLVITNIYQDPANIYHDTTRQIAERIIEGEEIFFRSGNGNMRSVRQYMIGYMPKHVDCITLGSSFTLCVRDLNVGTSNYYNLSVSEMNMNDFMAELAFLDLNGVEFDRIVFCVDSRFFDENFTEGSKKANG